MKMSTSMMTFIICHEEGEIIGKAIVDFAFFLFSYYIWRAFLLDTVL